MVKLIVGGTGTGKTKTIIELVESIRTLRSQEPL